MAERTWADVGVLVKKAREVRGMTQEDMAATANRSMNAQVLSSANLRVFEAGGRESYRTRTLVGIARALNWTDDAIERLLAGASLDDVTLTPAYVGAADETDTGAEKRGRDEMRRHAEEDVERKREAHHVRLASSEGLDFDELAELDPEGYDALMAQARLLLKRARERRG